MNLDFSDDQKQLREQLRRMFAERDATKSARAVIEGKVGFDRELWKAMGDLGFLGVSIPETYGGSGAGYLELAVIAEEIGRTCAAIPMQSSIYFTAELILAAGSDEQKKKWLPKLATGEAIGTLALFESGGGFSPDDISTTANGSRISGEKTPVLDGTVADFAIVATSGRTAAREVSLYLVDLRDSTVSREQLTCIDPTRQHATLHFNNSPAELLGKVEEGWVLLKELFDRSAVLLAFEQLGGSDRALEMARDYARERVAFGRPIGSFQAIKHILADMYVSVTLARSNCYYAAWAVSTDAAELPEAAAAARLSATQAFQHCSKNNTQVHGGMGFTWESDCHLYYRRANDLAVALGSASYWENQLIDALRARNAH